MFFTPPYAGWSGVGLALKHLFGDDRVGYRLVFKRQQVVKGCDLVSLENTMSYRRN